MVPQLGSVSFFASIEHEDMLIQYSNASCAAHHVANHDCSFTLSRGPRGLEYVYLATHSSERSWRLTSYAALEVYFSRTLGFSLITLGLLTVLLTGSVPLSSSLAEGMRAIPPYDTLSAASSHSLLHANRLANVIAGATTSVADPKAPYALPTLTITAIYHAIAAFYGYAMWTQTGVFSFGLGTIGSGFLSMIALWCILFASSNGRISRKTGADKRTSGFPV